MNWLTDIFMSPFKDLKDQMTSGFQDSIRKQDWYISLFGDGEDIDGNGKDEQGIIPGVMQTILGMLEQWVFNPILNMIADWMPIAEDTALEQAAKELSEATVGEKDHLETAASVVAARRKRGADRITDYFGGDPAEKREASAASGAKQTYFKIYNEVAVREYTSVLNALAEPIKSKFPTAQAMSDFLEKDVEEYANYAQLQEMYPEIHKLANETARYYAGLDFDPSKEDKMTFDGGVYALINAKHDETSTAPFTPHGSPHGTELAAADKTGLVEKLNRFGTARDAASAASETLGLKDEKAADALAWRVAGEHKATTEAATEHRLTANELQAIASLSDADKVKVSDEIKYSKASLKDIDVTAQGDISLTFEDATSGRPLNPRELRLDTKVETALRG